MASKKKAPSKPEEPGVPEWVVTFGDMMSLLLCFFILLAAFSELKKEHEYQQVVTAVKEAFGYVGGVGVVPTMDPPTKSLVQTLDQLRLETRLKTKVSQSDVQGMQGKHTSVKKIQDGLIFTIGGNSTFDRESAELKEPVKEDLRAIAQLIDGRRNIVSIRGHADSKVLPPDSEWTDLYELSYGRARSVLSFMTEELGLRPEVFRLTACGDTEPVNPRAESANTQQVNRRVEIILTNKLVDDVNSDADFTDPSHARGG
ncbi:MAG: hypothetical protein D8M59_12265 [Planctomycetes bacterium]|nr:hypothetical protein [Planctomycetota bacterium]NOG53583.1 flagellar motor protein MotB [Planctomycetota bacterium]